MITFVAWLLASNHCALAANTAADKGCHAAHAHCAAHDAPAHHKAAEGLECCKSLQAASVAPAKLLSSYDSRIFTWQLYVVGTLASPENARPTVLPQELETGPPRVETFAELVLQRSLLAHAPPIFS